MIGMIVEPRFSDYLRHRVLTLLGAKSDTFIFPGVKLCPLERGDLDLICGNDYLVSQKGTGERAFLVIVKEGTFIYHKSKQFYYIQMTFPSKQGQHFDTIIDGELYTDKQLFMCFDLMCIDGVCIVERSTSTRLGILQEDVLKPLLALHDNQLKVELTRHERSYGLERLLAADIHNLVFTPVKTPYTPFKLTQKLKLYWWVDPAHSLVAFKIKVVYDKDRKSHYQLLICEMGVHKYFDDFTPDPNLLSDWKQNQPDGKIIECLFDKDWGTHIWENGYASSIRKGGWKFFRFRPDLQSAEEEKKLYSRWNTIMDPVSRETLLDRVEEMRNEWKTREKRAAGIFEGPEVPKSIERPKVHDSRVQHIYVQNNRIDKQSPTKSQISSPINRGAGPETQRSEHEDGQIIENEFSQVIEEEIASGIIPIITPSDSIFDCDESENNSGIVSNSKTTADSTQGGSSSEHSNQQSKSEENKSEAAIPSLLEVANKDYLVRHSENFIPVLPETFQQPMYPQAENNNNDDFDDSQLVDLSKRRYEQVTQEHNDKHDEKQDKKSKWLDLILN